MSEKIVVIRSKTITNLDYKKFNSDINAFVKKVPSNKIVSTGFSTAPAVDAEGKPATVYSMNIMYETAIEKKEVSDEVPAETVGDAPDPSMSQKLL